MTLSTVLGRREPLPVAEQRRAIYAASHPGTVEIQLATTVQISDGGRPVKAPAVGLSIPW